MALGQLDHYLNKPWGDPEFELYPTVSELLSQRPTLRWLRVLNQRP